MRVLAFVACTVVLSLVLAAMQHYGIGHLWFLPVGTYVAGAILGASVVLK